MSNSIEIPLKQQWQDVTINQDISNVFDVISLFLFSSGSETKRVYCKYNAAGLQNTDIVLGKYRNTLYNLTLKKLSFCNYRSVARLQQSLLTYTSAAVGSKELVSRECFGWWCGGVGGGYEGEVVDKLGIPWGPNEVHCGRRRRVLTPRQQYNVCLIHYYI